jgi:apocytochrome f
LTNLDQNFWPWWYILTNCVTSSGFKYNFKTTCFFNWIDFFDSSCSRGQVYPDGSKSNNTVYTASRTGRIKEINPIEKTGGFEIVLETRTGNTIRENVPPGPEILVKVGQNIRADEPITNNPNVGGFGQAEAEIVLQNPSRIQGLLAFFRTVLLTQVFLVLKKKQFEKVQLAEINFLKQNDSEYYIS